MWLDRRDLPGSLNSRMRFENLRQNFSVFLNRLVLFLDCDCESLPSHPVSLLATAPKSVNIYDSRKWKHPDYESALFDFG